MVCLQCKINKKETEYPQRKGKRDGLICKECKKVYRREYYQKNKEKIKKYIKEWGEKNAEKLKNNRKIYYLKNKEKMNEATKKYYYNNKEKMNKKANKWRQNNAERFVKIVQKSQKKNRISGVYAIYCKKTDKVYVGSTVDIMQRYRIHIHDYKASRNNCLFFGDVDLYGWEAFHFIILERDLVEKYDRITMENWWQKFFKSTNEKYGYNKNIAGANL